MTNFAEPTLDVLTDEQKAEALRWSRADYLVIVPDSAFPGRNYFVVGIRVRDGEKGTIDVGEVYDARKPQRKTLRSWVYAPATGRARATSTYLWESDLTQGDVL